MQYRNMDGCGFIKKLRKYRVKYAAAGTEYGVSEPRKRLRNSACDPAKFAESVLKKAMIAPPPKTFALMSRNELTDYLGNLTHKETAELALYLIMRLKQEA